jgi:hypothetical protein
MVHEFRAGRRAPSANRHQRRAKAARSRSQVKKHWFIEVQQDPINQAANRFIARGCDRCGAPAVLGFSVFFVPNGADFLAVCGDCQIGQNLKPTITLNLDAMIDPWAEFDRDWFAAHPDRCLRLRKACPVRYRPRQSTSARRFQANCRDIIGLRSPTKSTYAKRLASFGKSHMARRLTVCVIKRSPRISYSKEILRWLSRVLMM